MRYYSNDYRDEVIASLNGLFSSLDDSYTVAICNVPDSETESMNSYKDSAIDAANQASATISSLSPKIETVISQLNEFYQNVDATGGEIYSRAGDIVSILVRTNSVVDEICDILNGVGNYSGYKASPDLLDTACLPLADVEVDRDAYWNDFYLDEDGLVDAAAVSATFELVGEPVGTNPDGSPLYSNEGEKILDTYAEFSVNYLSRDDCTTEMMESLTNANLAAGMVPSGDIPDEYAVDGTVPAPSPDTEIVNIDGVDYYAVYFPYESSQILEEYNNRVYQLSEERYRNSYNESGEPFDAGNVNQYLDIMRTITMDHHNLHSDNEPIDYNIAVPTLIPVSEVDPSEINPDIDFYRNFDTPPYSGFVSIDVDGEDEHLIVHLDTPDDRVDVVFFSTDIVFQEGNEYNSATAPRTGAYPSYGEYTFFYPCDYFEVHTTSIESSEHDFNTISVEEQNILKQLCGLDDDFFDRFSDGCTWSDYIFAYLDYVMSEEEIIFSDVSYGTISEAASTSSIYLGAVMYFVDQIKESYENNMALDQNEVDNLNDLAASLASFCNNQQGGYVVLHNDSGIDNFEFSSTYYPSYASWDDESVNNSLYYHGLGITEN